MYNIDQLIEKMTSGEIALDLNGHFTDEGSSDCPSEKRVRDRLLERLQRFQGQIAEHKTAASGKRFLDYILQDNKDGKLYTVSQSIDSLAGPIEADCMVCGEFLWAYLKDAHTISFAPHDHFGGPQGKLSIEPSPCKYQIRPKFFTAHIQVPTGRLLLTNFFKDVAETPEGKEYTRAYSLNHFAGREFRTDFLAKQDIGYGQMGNMSVDVYVDAAGKRIRILHENEDMVEDRLADARARGQKPSDNLLRCKLELDDLELEGFQLAGSLSLSMWRWMCADRATLEKLEVVVDDQQDQVECQVQVGTWEVNHYYDCLAGGESVVASELTLVEPAKKPIVLVAGVDSDKKAIAQMVEAMQDKGEEVLIVSPEEAREKSLNVCVVEDSTRSIQKLIEAMPPEPEYEFFVEKKGRRRGQRRHRNPNWK